MQTKIMDFSYRFPMLDGSSMYEAGMRCSTSSCESIKCGGGRRIKWIGNSGDSWCSGSRSIADVCGGSVAVETSSEFCEDGLADPDDNTSFGCWCSCGLSTPSSTSSGKVIENWKINKWMRTEKYSNYSFDWIGCCVL